MADKSELRKAVKNFLDNGADLKKIGDALGVKLDHLKLLGAAIELAEQYGYNEGNTQDGKD